jgi:hypothetical protein
MATKKKSPAKKEFCIWADHVERVYQHVEAESPTRAYLIAKKRFDWWESCEQHDSNGYRLSNEVQDLATEEFIAIHGTKNCRTCGSEIVETINDSNFRDGECGPCEYQRYAHDCIGRRRHGGPACEGLPPHHRAGNLRSRETRPAEADAGKRKVTVHARGSRRLFAEKASLIDTSRATRTYHAACLSAFTSESGRADRLQRQKAPWRRSLLRVLP